MLELYVPRLPIIEIQSFILFKTTGIAATLLEILDLSKRIFLAVSGSSSASNAAVLDLRLSPKSVNARDSQATTKIRETKYAPKVKFFFIYKKRVS